MESYGQSIVLRVFEQSRPLYDMLELFTGPAVYGWATGVRSASTAPSGPSLIRREERPEGRSRNGRCFSSPGVNAWAMGFRGNRRVRRLAAESMIMGAEYRSGRIIKLLPTYLGRRRCAMHPAEPCGKRLSGRR